MKLEETLLKDLCPKWLRLSAASRLRIGSIVMVGSVLWCVAAPWLSAHNKITVTMEFSSYWWAAMAFLYGAGNFLQYARFRLIGRLAIAGILATLSLVMVFESSRAFFHWKVKSISSEDLSKITMYLQNVGTEKEKKDPPIRSHARTLPLSLRPLGLENDYSGESGQFLETTPYTGHVAGVFFGNKLRQWGVHQGTEEMLDNLCPGCRRVRLGNNVYFFVGSGG